MEVNFGDTVPLSTLDWPGKSCSTFFFNECCFRCPYCQNYELLDNQNNVDIQEIFSEIQESAPYIDGVVASGGEPTLQIDALKELASYVKNKGLGFGLHTNGYYPDRVEKLLKKDLIDFVSLDIKAPLRDQEKYSQVSGVEIETNRIKETLGLLTSHELELETTTTVFKSKNTLNELNSIVSDLDNTKYVLQQGRTENAFKKEYREATEYSKKELIELAKKIDYENIFVRTKEEGEVEI